MASILNKWPNLIIQLKYLPRSLLLLQLRHLHKNVLLTLQRILNIFLGLVKNIDNLIEHNTYLNIRLHKK